MTAPIPEQGLALRDLALKALTERGLSRSRQDLDLAARRLAAMVPAQWRAQEVHQLRVSFLERILDEEDERKRGKSLREITERAQQGRTAPAPRLQPVAPITPPAPEVPPAPEPPSREEFRPGAILIGTTQSPDYERREPEPCGTPAVLKGLIPEDVPVPDPGRRQGLSEEPGLPQVPGPDRRSFEKTTPAAGERLPEPSAKPQAGRANSANSWKDYRDIWPDLTSTSYVTAGGPKLLGKCDYDDLIFAAGEDRSVKETAMSVAQVSHRAEISKRKLAQDLLAWGGRTAVVEDLPPEILARHLRRTDA